MTLIDLLKQDGASLKRVSGTHGGEYAGPCPSCGGSDRFHVWPEQGEAGRYWCRGCSKSGDAIQYLKDFRGLPYLEACQLLGREPRQWKRSLNWGARHHLHPFCTNFSENAKNGYQAKGSYKGVQGVQTVQRAGWQPRETTLPGDQWSTKAMKFVVWAEQQLWTTDQGKEALSWLHGRGLADDTVKAFHLGWNSQNWFPKREAWGLSTVLKDNGKPKKLFLPAGLVIPKLTGAHVVKVKIRRPDVPPEKKYFLLPGSDTGPLVIPGRPVCIVVESELDAILLHQEAGELATMIALGSASIRPDQAAAEILNQADSILVSLDADDAGAKSSWGWWHGHYPTAKRWPSINGKDPSEARQNGLDLQAWVMAGLLPDLEPEADPEGHQESTDGCVDIATDDTQPDVQIASQRNFAPTSPNGDGLVKCDYCTHLAGYRCTRGHQPDGIALLRECNDFTFSRKGLRK